MDNRLPWIAPKVVRLVPPQFDREELGKIAQAVRRGSEGRRDMFDLARKAERLESQS